MLTAIETNPSNKRYATEAMLVQRCSARCKHHLPKKALKRDNRYQRDKKRKLCKRRAAIEPIIGHLKSDFRLSRNLLKGQVGDEINVLMAACAWNLRKWLIATAIFLFWQKVGLCMVRSRYFFYCTQ
ncbi:ISPg7, transposase [uncultured Gammaproteobacteria bacterium]|nr:ISPg7, transposase [uncultured Gammaproteobacteria bacterium]